MRVQNADGTAAAGAPVALLNKDGAAIAYTVADGDGAVRLPAGVEGVRSITVGDQRFAVDTATARGAIQSVLRGRQIRAAVTFFGQVLAPTGAGQGGVEVAVVDGDRILATVISDPNGAWVLTAPLPLSAAAALRIAGLPAPVPLPSGGEAAVAGSVIGPLFQQLTVIPEDLAPTSPASALLTAGTDVVRELLRRAPQLFARGISTQQGSACNPFTPRDGATEVHRFGHLVLLASSTGLQQAARDQQVAADRPLWVTNSVLPAPGLRYGMLLGLDQTWQSLGLALGDLLYSLPLAPAESVNIAVIDWQRSDTAVRSSTVDESTSQVQDFSRNRAVQDVMHSHATRDTDAWSINGTASGTVGFASLSVSGGYSNTHSVTDIAQSASQNLSDSIHNAATAVRSSRAVTIVQTTETESSTTTTRTVRNHNHAHTLTFQYFEVVQRYLLSTRVASVDPVVLVPFEPIDFSSAANIDRYGDVITAHLRDAELAPELRAWLDRGRPTTPSSGSSTAPPATTPPLADDPVVTQLRIVATIADNPRPLNGGDLRKFVVLHAPGGQLQRLVWTEDSDTSRSALLPLFPGVHRSMFVGIGLANIFNLADDPTTDDHNWHTVFTDVSTEVTYQDGRVETLTHDTDVHLPDLTTRTLTWQVPQPAAAIAVSVPAPSPRLVAHLQANALFYTGAVLSDGDPLHRWALLSSVRDVAGRAITDIADPTPVAVIGPYLALPLVSTDFVPQELMDELNTADALANGGPWTPTAYAAVGADDLVVLPTGGVYAESQLGTCPAAETIDNSVFWQWTDDGQAPGITDEMVKSRFQDLKDLLEFVNPGLSATTLTTPDEPNQQQLTDPFLGNVPTTGTPPAAPEVHPADHGSPTPETFDGGSADHPLTVTFGESQADFTTRGSGATGESDTARNTADIAALQVFVDNARRVRATGVRVVGYASHDGDATANQALAQRRADATVSEITHLWSLGSTSVDLPHFDTSAVVGAAGSAAADNRKAVVWIVTSRGADPADTGGGHSSDAHSTDSSSTSSSTSDAPSTDAHGSS